MFSDGDLNAVRSATSIVDLISEYVQLKKSGQGYQGLCPFHNEKTPSFHVHPQKQIFHCFGCHKGGNVFSFLSAIDGIAFPEAVRKLAKRAGIELDDQFQKRRPAPVKIPGIDRVHEALGWAAKYFNYLLMEVPEYKFAREYLTSRGLTERSIKMFNIGVSPKGWNTLMDLMVKRNFTFEELVQAGLVIQKEEARKGGYDRFRERLMFPIRNPDGQVLGFGARLLKDEPNQPKYLNSPESPVFEKRKIWYGMFENQRGIRLRGEAVIVEGYMDVVGLWENGVDNGIATMGTALTEEHCGILKPLTNRVVTVFDSDTGGQDAWKRSVSLFLNSGIFAKDLSLPEGKDPDEFIQGRGKEEFFELCEKAPRQITKLLREMASQGPLSEQQTATWLEKLTPILVASRRLPDRAILWDNISLVMKVSIEALKEVAEGGARHFGGRETENRRPDSHAHQRPQQPPKVKKMDPLTFDILKASIKYGPEFFSLLEKYPKESWWHGVRNDRAGLWLEKIIAGGLPQLAAYLNEIVSEETDPEILSLASEGLITTHASAQKADVAGVIEGLLQKLTSRQREQAIKSMSAQVKLTERMGKDDEGIRLLEEVVKQRRRGLAERD